MRIPISDRALGIPTNVFSSMDDRVEDAVRRGMDIIDLSKANPDLPTPRFIVAAGQKALEDVTNHRYSHFDGKPGFLQAVQNWYHREQHVRLDRRTQLLATCGSIVGLSTLTQVALNPGDILAVADPYYPPYAALARVAGAQLHPIPCSWESGFLPDFSAVEDTVWSRTKLLLLNYPNNPTGAMASKQLYEQAVALAHRYGFLVANDFAYAGLGSYDIRPDSLLTVADAYDVAVETMSLSKMYGMAGWRLGCLAGPPWLMRHLREYHHQMCSSPTGAVQDAGAVALNADQACVGELAHRYAARMRILSSGLHRAGIEVFASQGGLFVWARVPHAVSDDDFAQVLLRRANVAVMPGSCFGAGGKGYMRLSLLESESRLEEASRRIAAIADGLI